MASFSLWANVPEKALTRDSILALIPPEFATLSTDTTKEELETTFQTKTIQKESSSIHLGYFRKKNDITIGTKDGTYSYLYVEASDEILQKSKGLFQKVIATLTKEDRELNARQQKTGTHDSGRFITIELPKLGIKLSFVDNEKKDLHSIIIWPVGENIP